MRFLVIALSLVACACSAPKPPDDRDYVTRLTADRAAKDAQFMRDSEPVPDNRKATLLPLDYYPIDPAYDVPAALKPSGESGTIFMPTSAGTEDEYRRVGTLEFTLQGRPLKLAAYVPVADQTMARLFVPFQDVTSGTETYGGGRYLDLDRTASGLYAIDFNLAYNPNCYFDLRWICPIPPRENHLDIPITAGERVKPDAKS